MIEAMATRGCRKSPGDKTPVPRPAFLAAGALDSPTCSAVGALALSPEQPVSPGNSPYLIILTYHGRWILLIRMISNHTSNSSVISRYFSQISITYQHLIVLHTSSHG